MKRINKAISNAAMVLSAAAVVGCSGGYNEPDSSIQTMFFGITDGIEDVGGSANLNPSFLDTRDFFALQDVSLGYTSHKWELFQVVDDNMEYITYRDIANYELEYIDDYDFQMIRQNSGIPSTQIDDIDPELYTYNPAVDPCNDLSYVFGYFDVPGRYVFRITNLFPKSISYPWRSAEYVDGVIVGIQVWFTTPEISDGVFQAQHDYDICAHMKLEGNVSVYTDAAMNSPIDLEWDFREEEDYAVYDVKVGQTLYFDAYSGVTLYDKIDYNKWVAEYYSYGGNSASPTSLPVISDVESLSTGVTFDQAGAFRMVVWQAYYQPETCDSPNYPTTTMINPIPIIFNVE
ncbi:MAG: hypothetical protein R3Y39_08695 [Rikenellaceae bacterium]